MKRFISRLCALGCLLLLVAAPLLADGGIVFTDVADDPATGITYERIPTPREALRDAAIAQTPAFILDFLRIAREEAPQKARGAPGVALLDFDGDGDLDVYVTNSPGAANSLYSNQLVETGSLSFVDVAAAAGVAATAQDSTGVCFGDIDNDGDPDLHVVSTGDDNLLFENQGDGTFLDITPAAGVGGNGRYATSCAMGDVDGDGLLDLFVSNTYDSWDTRAAILTDYPFLEHNQLFMNQGGNVFTDETAARGLENVSNMNQPGLSGASWTWISTLVDYDQDGDLDMIWMDNQGARPRNRSQERGWLRLFDNDGTGHFTDVTVARGLDIPGAWMGVDFGDLDCDGHLDFFATDVGFSALAPSRWFYGTPSGSFIDSLAGDLHMTPFGWGTSIFDYDNDGDSDIVYHGGMDVFNFIDAGNPGVVLTNEGLCSGDFDYDAPAVPKDHRFRAVEGVAVGDLDLDGFEDIAAVSAFDVTPQSFFPFVGIAVPPQGSPFDALSVFEETFVLDANLFASYIDPIMNLGTLSLEISSGGNGNGWVDVTVRGGVGVHGTAAVNRDGIGAVVSFTPDESPTSIRPIAGGSSYASQDALSAHFGLGGESSGTVEVLWPGGVRNRLYDVTSGERVLFPEIPCGFDAAWPSRQDFRLCVRDALKTYRHPSVGWISNPEDFKRFEDSMLRAYDETH